MIRQVDDEKECGNVALEDDEVLISVDSGSDVHTSPSWFGEESRTRENDEEGRLVNADGLGMETFGKGWCDWLAEIGPGVHLPVTTDSIVCSTKKIILSAGILETNGIGMHSGDLRDRQLPRRRR